MPPSAPRSTPDSFPAAAAPRLGSWPLPMSPADRLRSARLQPYAVTIFAEMSALAARIGAVNLGQGFPDEDGPAAMLKTAENAIAEGVNQYPPGPGIAPLREAIAAQRKRHFGIELRPRHRGAGHRRRHRGDRRVGHRPRRAGLRGAADRAVLRLLLPRHRDGGLPARRRAAGAPTDAASPSTSTRLRGAVTPRTRR